MGKGAGNSLAVYLTGNASSFNRTLYGARKTLSSFTSSLSGMSGMIAGALGGVSVGYALKSSLQAYMEQEDALSKLAGVLDSTGGAAGYNVRQLDAYASELQSMTTFADDAIESAMTLLATFRNVKGGVFKDATKAALDMATVLGGDATAAAGQLGKALNNPKQGLASLGRLGIVFSDQQKQQIENYQKQGNLAAAQKMILDEIQKKYGGAAQAAAGTVSGQLKQAANIFGDIKEQIGFIIVEGLKLPQVLAWAKEQLDAIGAWFAAGNGLKWFIEIEYGFRKVFAILGMIGENIAAPILWFQENFALMWKNALGLLAAVGKDLLHIMLLPLKLYFDFWKTGWTKAWEFLKSGGKGGVGGFIDGMIESTMDSYARQLGNVGRETEIALAKMGATELKMNSYGDMADRTKELDAQKAKAQAEAGKPYAKILAKQIAPQVEVAVEAKLAKLVEMGPLKFAAAVEQGSVEAYKAALPSREDEQIKLQREQLAVQKQLVKNTSIRGFGSMSVVAIGA